MQKPLVQSVVFHVLVFVILILSGLEYFSRKDTEIKQTPITVEIMQIGDKTNIRPAPKQQTPPKPVQKKPQPKPEPKPVEKKPEIKPEPKPEPKPEIKPEVKPEPKPQPKPETKPKKKPDPKPEPKKDDSADLDSLLKSLDDVEPAHQSNTDSPDADPNSKSDSEFDPTQPMTVAELDYIKSLIMRQIAPCWNVPAGAPDAAALKVGMDIDIESNGVMKFIGFNDIGNSGSPYYQIAAESARRAVQDPRCNPLQELPPMDKFDQWHELTVIFDPKDLVY